jgi:hypothetical protein
MSSEIIQRVTYDNYDVFLTCQTLICTKFHFIILKII